MSKESKEEYRKRHKEVADRIFGKEDTFPKRKKIELVEDRYTGTLYEMEVDDEDNVCPVVRDYNNRDKK